MIIIQSQDTIATRTRAQRAIDIILDSNGCIGQRRFDACFEMGDGEAVNDLVFKTLAKDKIKFHDLPWKSQYYFGESVYNERIKESNNDLQEILDL